MSAATITTKNGNGCTKMFANGHSNGHSIASDNNGNNGQYTVEES